MASCRRTNFVPRVLLQPPAQVDQDQASRDSAVEPDPDSRDKVADPGKGSVGRANRGKAVRVAGPECRDLAVRGRGLVAEVNRDQVVRVEARVLVTVDGRSLQSYPLMFRRRK